MQDPKISFENGYIHLTTRDKREEKLPIRLYPRLYNASHEQLQDYYFSPMGIHWPKLDEDLSFEGFFLTENHPKNNSALCKLFFEYPELNLRQVAKSAGLNTTLLQQYVDGHKKPSAERLKQIEEYLHRLGKELSEFCLSAIE